MRSHVATLLIFLFTLASGLTWSNVSHIQLVHDTVLPPKKTDSRGVLSASSPLPDWSDVIRHEKPHYVEILIAIDAGVSRFYSHKPERILNAVASMMHAVNMYTFQLNIRLIIVDVVPVKGHNLSLEQFLEWRREQEALTPHDVAILVRHRYEGGIAYVNGVCKRTAVGICGFFPEAPFEYASVFFHELAHLLGLTHDTRANCQCSKKNRNNCLRIDGFEHDCSAQALVDLLPTHDCIQAPILPLPRSVVALCGNGVVENDEDCDCGPEGWCDNVFCDARSCRFIFGRNYLYTTVTFGLAVVIFSCLLLVKRSMYKQQRKNSSVSATATKAPMLPSPSPPQIVVLPSTLTKNTERVNLKERSLLPCIVPTRPAPAVPQFRVKLDQHIPLTTEEPLPPGYMKMHPARNPESTAEEEPTHLPTVSHTLEKMAKEHVKIMSKTLDSRPPPPPPDKTKKPRFYDRPPDETN